MKCPNDCNDHGNCLENGKCECEIGYYGNNCKHKCRSLRECYPEIAKAFEFNFLIDYDLMKDV